jgi:hypothetical protein
MTPSISIANRDVRMTDLLRFLDRAARDATTY